MRDTQPRARGLATHFAFCKIPREHLASYSGDSTVETCRVPAGASCKA